MDDNNKITPDNNNATDNNDSMDDGQQTNSEQTSDSGLGGVGAISFLIVFIGLIIFLGYYLYVRNTTNTPTAIITDFGSTYISTINGRVLSITLESIVDSNLEDQLVMSSDGNIGDANTGWTLTKDPTDPTIVIIQSNFTQTYVANSTRNKDNKGFLIAGLDNSDFAFRYKINFKKIQGVNRNSSGVKPTTITTITFESQTEAGKFIVAGPDGTVTLDKPVEGKSDYIFQVINI